MNESRRKALMYHHIKEHVNYRRGISPADFERQLIRLKDTHVFTFDDGLKEHYSVVFPLLRKNNVTGYFFPIAETLVGIFNHVHMGHILIDAFEEDLIAMWNERAPLNAVYANRDPPGGGKYSGLDGAEMASFKNFLAFGVGSETKNKVFGAIMREHGISVKTEDYYVTKSELREMSEAGMIIGNHTVTHPPLAGMQFRDQLYEIKCASVALVKALGKTPTAFSYPFGSYDKNTLLILERLGYEIAFTTDEPTPTDDPLRIGRIDCRADAADEQKKVVRSYFGGMPREYYDSYGTPSALECLNIILDMIQKMGLRILDAGCGPGYLTEILAMNNSVTGIDISEEMIKFAKKKSKTSATYLLGDAETFTVNEKFDLIVAKGVFEYLETDGRAFANFSRLLKPRGRLVASFRHAGFAHGNPGYVDPYPMKRRTHDPEKLSETAKKFGFKLVDVRFYHYHKGLRSSDAASAFVASFEKEADRQ